MKSLTCIAIAVFLLLSGGIVQAVPITVTFSGVIDSAADYYGDEIKIGDAYSASFVFDSATQDLDPAPQTGVYGSLSSTIIVGQITFTGIQGSGNLRVIDNPSGDRLTLWCSGSSSPDIGSAHLEADLRDQTATAFSSDALPLPATAPPLGAFQQVFFGVVRTAGPGKFGGTISSLEIIPEPGTLCLILLGAAMALRRA